MLSYLEIRTMARKYVSFKDETQPLGKRKVAYVNWLMKKIGIFT